jgi:hypothetical protein
MEDGGLFNKILSVGERLTPVPGTGTSIVGSISGILNKSSASNNAVEFLSSTKFRQAIEAAAKSGNATDADNILKSSLRYQAWKRDLTKQQIAQLSAVGFIAYITEENNAISN